MTYFSNGKRCGTIQLIAQLKDCARRVTVKSYGATAISFAFEQEVKKMYYVLGTERKAGKKNGNYHIYEITMERKRASEAVESLMEFDKSTAPAGKPSNMDYKVIETDGKEFFEEYFESFDIFEKLKDIAQRAKEFLEIISDTLQNASDTLAEACKIIDK